MSTRRQPKSKSKLKTKAKAKAARQHKLSSASSPLTQPSALSSVEPEPSDVRVSPLGPASYPAVALLQDRPWSDVPLATRTRTAALYGWKGGPAQTGDLAPVAEALTAAPLIVLRALEAAVAAGGLIRASNLAAALGGEPGVASAAFEACVALGVAVRAQAGCDPKQMEHALLLIRELADVVAAAACGVLSLLSGAPDTPREHAQRPPESTYDHVAMVTGTAAVCVKCTPQRTNAHSAKAYARHHGLDADATIDALDIATGNGSLRIRELGALPDVARLTQLFEVSDQAPIEFSVYRNAPLPPPGMWVPRTVLLGAHVDPECLARLEFSEPARDRDTGAVKPEQAAALVLGRSRRVYEAPLKGAINSAFDVTLEKEGTVADFAQLTACLELTRLERVARYRITPLSVTMGAHSGADLLRVRALLDGLSPGGVSTWMTGLLDKWFADGAALASLDLEPQALLDLPCSWQRFLEPPVLQSTHMRATQADPVRETLDIQRMAALLLDRYLDGSLHHSIHTDFRKHGLEPAALAWHRALHAMRPTLLRVLRELSPRDALRLVTGVYSPIAGPAIVTVPLAALADELRLYAHEEDPNVYMRGLNRRHALPERLGALLPLFSARHATALTELETAYAHQAQRCHDEALNSVGNLLTSCPVASRCDFGSIEGSMYSRRGDRRQDASPEAVPE